MSKRPAPSVDPFTQVAVGMLMFLSVWALVVAELAINAAVLSILWRWFVVPVTQWPALSVAAAAGIRIVVASFQGIESPSKSGKISKGEFWNGLATAVVTIMGKNAGALCLGWILLRFV